MQNPEVWNFREPQSSIKVQELNTSNFSIKHIRNFNFNHLISVVLPDTLKIPDNLENILTNDCEYYKVFDLNLADLLNQAFLNNFIKKGKLILLSVETRIDCDNCCAVTLDGNLILSLTKDTYQCFGLEGKISHFTKRNKDRYSVKIDLNDPKLKPGKPYYEKTKTALGSLQTFSVIINWSPQNETVCPSSIAKYFNQIGYGVKLCCPTFKSHVTYSVPTPTLSQESIEESDLIDFVEFLGMVSIEGDFSGNPNSYENTYEAPEPNMEIGQLRVLVWRGFYQPDQVMGLINFLEQYNNIEDKLWISVYVQGFSDSPIIELEEQNYFTSGDNANICILKKSKCWFCKFRCSAKRYK